MTITNVLAKVEVTTSSCFPERACAFPPGVPNVSYSDAGLGSPPVSSPAAVASTRNESPTGTSRGSCSGCAPTRPETFPAKVQRGWDPEGPRDPLRQQR